jgi:formyltetrahydrofolate deformylase
VVRNSFIVTLSCPDRPGIVHAVSGALLEAGCNISESRQYESRDTGTFFMRVSVETDEPRDALEAALAPVAQAFDMKLGLYNEGERVRTLIMCSKDGRTLNDLLFQQRTGTLPIDVPVIVSNHTDLAPMAEFYGIPFVHLPVTSATKAEAEAKLLALVEEYDVELVVLARYMQILSDDLCRALEGRAINIHHSFLPSFKGAKPYHQAHARGVKIIGATAHYVTADLDEGPIIEQDVARVDHSFTVEDLTAQGRDTESQVLARAVKWHSEHRVLLNGHKTVIFG